MKQTMKAVTIGTCLWAIALVVEIARSAPSSTIWICLTGLGLGLIGVLDMVRRMRKK